MWGMFRKSNDINEHSVAAFVALGLVVIIVFSIIIGNFLCKELVIPEFIFVSLLTFAAASLGIAGYSSINGKDK